MWGGGLCPATNVEASPAPVGHLARGLYNATLEGTATCVLWVPRSTHARILVMGVIVCLKLRSLGGGFRRVDPTWVWGRHCSGYQQGRQAPRPEPWERPSFTGSAEAPRAFRRAGEVGTSPHGSELECRRCPAYR